ncbi:MAG: histidinol-phosphate transaminase [Crocinitomicaceae bacterium]|nr:histidinol-phosphate transaminase [Crocinitomicaceae bacterium]
MNDLKRLVRSNIWDLIPYSSAREEYNGSGDVFLDANENPFGTLNRYPDPVQKELKQQLASRKNVNVNQIFIGNGSDEIIDLVFRIFCNPGSDKALTFSPTYGMYNVSATMNDVELMEVPLTENFQIDSNNLSFFEDPKLKLVFICSPNNPTGNLINPDEISLILNKFNGIVVLDEAYIDFSNSESWSQQLNRFPNLIVLQTFSKAHGLASARVGVAYADIELIALLNKVKPPYNVSALNQQAALQSLNRRNEYETNIELILNQRNILSIELEKLNCVKRVYPSDANFLLVEFVDSKEVYEQLLASKIVVRNRDMVVSGCLRITVGTVDENKQLLKVLTNWKN